MFGLLTVPRLPSPCRAIRVKLFIPLFVSSLHPQLFIPNSSIEQRGRDEKGRPSSPLQALDAQAIFASKTTIVVLDANIQNHDRGFG
jgi:hypothetical protein